MRFKKARRLAAMSAAATAASLAIAGSAHASQQAFCSGSYTGSGGASWCSFSGSGRALTQVEAVADWSVGVGALRASDGSPYSDMNYNNGYDPPGAGITAYHSYGGSVSLRARLHSNHGGTQSVTGTFYW